jgi:dATP pyrophosphohydrolase
MLRDPFSVLVVIENQQQQFLLLQRTDDPNFWQSVTGGIEPNESALDCAYREVLEETGIDCQQHGYTINDLNITNTYPIREQWLHRYKPNSLINTEYVFHLVVDAEQVVKLDPNEHLAYQWLAFDKAFDIAWSASNKEAYKIVQDLKVKS